MTRILVMIPSGEVYDHDCVRWYQASDIQRSIDHYHNIGDAFVFDSSLKLLDFDHLGVIEIRECDPAKIDQYNEEYDYCFLRGSNYINSSMKWERTLEVIERLRIPVIAFGIGAQAPSEGPLILSDETKNVLRAMSDHCVSLGVRGSYTAQVLWDIGVKNARIVGCPTLFRNRRPDLRIDLPAMDAIKNAGYTLRREVSTTYSPDIERHLAFQKETMLDMSNRFDLTVMAQGEIEEKKIVFGTEEQRNEALAQLTTNNWLGDGDDPLRKLYETKLFYSDVVADYDTIAQKQDFVIGFRLHGNLISLANGVPSLYFTYDSRTSEFVETFGIPAYDVYSSEAFHLEDFWDQALFEKFNRTYFERYRDMRQFLEENNLPHRMPDPNLPVRMRDVA
ncbi:MAG: polysaccharide pyruvyl transferase family protein [Rhodospirillaceae bacterium]|nr:polysaccharide pyruvyl transferase family protein [Rhodospirillaceae bacterium]